MAEGIEIKGGAGEFEAAIIAVVVDRLARQEARARRGPRSRRAGLSAWVRAAQSDPPRVPRETLRPD